MSMTVQGVHKVCLHAKKIYFLKLKTFDNFLMSINTIFKMISMPKEKVHEMKLKYRFKPNERMHVIFQLTEYPCDNTCDVFLLIYHGYC